MSTLPGNGPVLVHLASGVGNLVLATPLLAALDEMGFDVDLRLDADYPQASELFSDWCAVRSSAARLPLRQYRWVLPAVPPFYWTRFAAAYRHLPNCVHRPPDSTFYVDEQSYYLAFAQALGYPPDRRPSCRLPIAPVDRFGVTAGTLVIAPGSKTGEMAAKRWPSFPELAARFRDVAIVGISDDLPSAGFPGHCRSFVDLLSLRETAALMASAGVVAGNDCGLAHVAWAVGTPTVMIFGPTDHCVLGVFPDYVRILRAGLPCEPCWGGMRLHECRGRVDCLAAITVDRAADAIAALAPGVDLGR